MQVMSTTIWVLKGSQAVQIRYLGSFRCVHFPRF